MTQIKNQALAAVSSGNEQVLVTIKHLNIKIYGQVQGVFFRISAQKEAEKLRITCSARNEPDGSVYIEVEGEEGSLEKFVKWCHKGPTLARVEKVEII